jgi:hypothetical protein
VLTFYAGDRQRPRGHALLFFHDSSTPGEVWVTYLVVAPVTMDLARYVPAAFAQSLGGMLPTMRGPAAFPLPPIPEKMEGGLAAVERLAALRDDDILDGGTLRASDPFQVVQPVADQGTEYAAAYEAYVSSAPAVVEETGPRAIGETTALPGVDVDDLLLQVMDDRDKIGRLARLVGTLRYAVEGGDQGLAGETVADMERVSRTLSEKYRAAELVAAAKGADPRSGELAQLLVERCYRLVDEDYGSLPDLDRRIQALRPPPTETPADEH